MTAKTEQQRPKLSKLGEWIQTHRGGIIVVNDWKAVNR